MLAAQLTRALERAGIPVYGVRIVVTNDRATWQVDYKPAATPAQIVTAESLKATFDPANDPAFLDEQADLAIDGQKVLKAVVLWCAGKFGLTPAQAKGQIVAIYRALP